MAWYEVINQQGNVYGYHGGLKRMEKIYLVTSSSLYEDDQIHG